jgi:hypothetical protein
LGAAHRPADEGEAAAGSLGRVQGKIRVTHQLIRVLAIIRV